MNIFFGHAKLILAAAPLFVAALLSACGSGCGTLGVANTSTCGSATSSAASTVSTYAISGTVSGTSPLNVTITLTGAEAGSTATDANGNYSFAALPNGSYSVVPTHAGNVFAPVSTAVTIGGANVSGISFTETASAAATSGISGTVSGAVKQGVLMTLTLGSINTGTAFTDASGNYSFDGFAAGNYTVTPSLSGHIFSPSSNAVTTTSSTTSAGINFTEN